MKVLHWLLTQLRRVVYGTVFLASIGALFMGLYWCLTHVPVWVLSIPLWFWIAWALGALIK